MYSIGDKILYGSSGACEIAEISLMRFGRTREQYYVLRPLFHNSAVIYVPVNSESLVSKMRSMPSKNDIEQLILDIPDAETVWIEDAQERKATYDALMRSGNCFDRVKLVKTLSAHKKLRLSEGKNLHVSDENFLREAQKLLCDEFAYPLQLSPSQVFDYIKSKIGEQFPL